MKGKTDLSANLFFARAKEIETILRRAVRHALLAHKRAGNSIAEWRDGQVIIIPPEEIAVDDPLEKKSE